MLLLKKTRLTFASTNVVSTRNAVLDRLLGALDQVPPFVWPQAADLSSLIAGENNQVYYYSIGMLYDKDNWLVQSEFALTDSKWPSVAMTNGYLSVGRRVGSVTFYIIGAYAKSHDKPYDQPSNSTVRADFYYRITQKSVAAINAYWARLIFTGRASSPRVVVDHLEMLEIVEKKPEAIGYIAKEYLNDRVAVVLEIKAD